MFASNPRTLLRLLSAEFCPTDWSTVAVDDEMETGAFKRDVPATLDKFANETGVSPENINP